jgi:hypothetical protein
MFKCQITGKMSKPGEKSNKLVLETREKVYYGFVLNEETEEMEEVEVGRGFEVVKEVNATDEGAKIWLSRQGLNP